MSMTTDELREAYLDFFASKGCVRRPSDVLVPDDETVLFTPAGMNQFKREFMGLGDPSFTRATTCQKCLRTGDIENVGKTAFHETFFEMLGNFSFGDYFKREAIHWAWEFLTDVLKLPPDRLTITVYLDDDEAYSIWHDEVKVPADRITRMGEDDNFWPAGAPTHGPNGVCGPCLFELVPVVADVMKRPYPELGESIKRIQTVVRQEEEQFLRNLENGLKLLNDTFRTTKAGGSDVVSGKDAFTLHATHGIPVE